MLALTMPISDARMMTGAQIRAARSFLRWTTRDLADKAGVGIATVHRAEACDDIPPLGARTLARLQAALEGGGVILIDRGETSPPAGSGVRLSR